jgi:15-cis-phytoene synthase
MVMIETAQIAPTALDPRLLVMVPRDQRDAVAAWWRLEARLFGVVATASEAMLAQIKLAWWRDRLAQVAALPKGEPLLAELAAQWQGRDALTPVVDSYEAILLAEDGDTLAHGGRALGAAMRGVMPGGAAASQEAGELWGLIRATQLAVNPDWRAPLLTVIVGAAPAKGPRALHTLDRWAQLLALGGGAASGRAEGWLLLRAGLGL